ncbi:MAG TPA: gamma-glutamyl-phosphate reductase, partial [Solirubrobacteraceae bacterium]
MSEICRAAKSASRELAQLDTGTKDHALEAIAAAIDDRTGEILEANARDMEAGRAAKLDAAFLDKLRLDEARVAAISAGVRAIVALRDPVGELIEG